MIRPLRRSHFWIWVALAVLLPSLFTVGLLARCETTAANSAVHWEQLK